MSEQERKLKPPRSASVYSKGLKLSRLCFFGPAARWKPSVSWVICPRCQLHLLTVPRLYHHQAFPSRMWADVRGQWLWPPVRRRWSSTQCPERTGLASFTLSSSLASSTELPKERLAGGNGKNTNKTENRAGRGQERGEVCRHPHPQGQLLLTVVTPVPQLPQL